MARGNIPGALNDVEIYIGGSNRLAGIGEVELPNAEYSTVTAEQIGMTSEYEVPLLGHFKKLEAKIKMDCIDHTLLNFNNNDAILVECKGALQSINRITHAAITEGIDATFKGLIKKFDGPKLKPGSKLDSSFDLSVSYYKLEIGGKVIIEIDVLNNINNINGSNNDLIRKFLGLI